MKRYISALLALVMLLSLAPTAALADSDMTGSEKLADVALYELSDAVADEAAHLVNAALRQSNAAQCVICRIVQVGKRVKKRSVQVKYNDLFSHVFAPYL